LAAARWIRAEHGADVPPFLPTSEGAGFPAAER
jgi:hypothetical protein